MEQEMEDGNIQKLQEKINYLKIRIPACYVSPTLCMELERLEGELAKLKKNGE